MSSRHYPYISVPGRLEITMECWNAIDILKYVQSELCLQNKSRTYLREGVAAKASGVSLWVVLVVASLLKKERRRWAVKEVQRILESVPKELDKLFTGD